MSRLPDSAGLAAADCLALGRQQLANGDYTAAVRSYLAANAQQPDDAPTSLGLGMAFSLAGRHEEARLTLEYALTLSQGNADYAFALAEAHKRAGNLRTAEKIYLQTLAIAPRHLMSAHNLGALLYAEERFAEAAQRHLHTLHDHPGSSMTWRDLGQSLIAAGQLEDGIAFLETARQTFPDDRTTQFALSLAYLRNECWEKGWPLYEARWHPGETLPTAPGAAPWSGESLAGQRLVVTSEQGFGDSIMFVRYLPFLAAEAAHVTLSAPPPLVTLFTESFAAFGNITIASRNLPLPVADFCTPIASLPLHCLQRGLREPPLPPSYLGVDLPTETSVCAALHQLAPGAGKNIGLVWRGNKSYVANGRRSLNLETLLPRLPAGEYRYFSLQLDVTGEEQARLAAAGIPDLSANLADFHDTAAWLKALDGLICVDTAIVHLAGALGRPALMLRRADGEWRWGKDQSCRPWYATLTARSITDIATLPNGTTIALPW